MTSNRRGRRTIGSLFVASVLLLAVAAWAFSLSQVPIVSSNADIDQQLLTSITHKSLTFTKYTRTLSLTRTLPSLTFPGRSCAVEGISTDRSEYHLGDTVTILLCYPVPEKCPLPYFEYDIYALHEGSQLDQIASFGGYIGCGAHKTFTYQPPMKGLYTIVLDQSPPGDVVSATDFSVGDASSNGPNNGSPVGGEVVQVSAFQLLIPWIGLSTIVASVLLAGRYLRNKAKG